MSLPELDRKCPDCGGAGLVQSAEWADYWHRRSEVLSRAGGPRLDPANIEALVGPQPECPEEITCGACDGRQRILTEDGQRLLDFIRRHLVDDVIHDVRAIGATLDRAEAAANRAASERAW